jgi:hypothetical protein
MVFLSGQDHEQQNAEQDEEHIDLEKPRMGSLQEMGQAERGLGTQVVDVEGLLFGLPEEPPERLHLRDFLVERGAGDPESLGLGVAAQIDLVGARFPGQEKDDEPQEKS